MGYNQDDSHSQLIENITKVYMQAELIIIGNELLNGKIKDKNIHYFSKFCFKNNLDLYQVQIIKDTKEALHNALDIAFKRSDFVLTTGGLGPTKDDQTKELLAQYFNKEINFSKRALEITQAHYKRGKREFNKETNLYPNIPDDFLPLSNPTGYAPGLLYKFEDKKILAATPGIPREFQTMLDEVVSPLLPTNNSFSKHIIIKTNRIAESKIFNELCPNLWEELQVFGEVSSLPHPLGVDIAVVINKPHDEDKVLSLIDKSKLKDHIWHIGADLLEEVIIKEATLKKLKIGFAESCTGGLCASRITDISGSSSVFWGSIISYSNEVKIRSLNVKEETLNHFGAVSAEVAKEMAVGALENMNLDIAITTTGIAGPGGGSKEKPVGTVGIGFATKEKSDSKIYHFSGNNNDREGFKFKFSQAALFKLLEVIRAYDS